MIYLKESNINLFLVGLIWGVTNPFMKRGSCGVEKINEKNKIKQVFFEILYLTTNWQYTIPFAIANIGSVLYFITLQSSDLTIAVPVANSLAFMFTALTGWILGEERPDVYTLVGMLIIVAGIYCYALSSS